MGRERQERLTASPERRPGRPVHGGLARLAPRSGRPLDRLYDSLGNRAFGRLVAARSAAAAAREPSRAVVQAKLAVSAPGDASEREADRLAQRVARHIASP